MGLLDSVMEALVALMIIFVFIIFIIPALTQFSGPLYGLIFTAILLLLALAVIISIFKGSR